MRATQEHEITLFGGEHIASGYRGRHSGSEISKQTSRRMAVVFGGLLIGFKRRDRYYRPAIALTRG